jgi:hypothetical protein
MPDCECVLHKTKEIWQNMRYHINRGFVVLIIKCFNYFQRKGLCSSTPCLCTSYIINPLHFIFRTAHIFKIQVYYFLPKIIICISDKWEIEIFILQIQFDWSCIIQQDDTCQNDNNQKLVSWKIDVSCNCDCLCT